MRNWVEILAKIQPAQPWLKEGSFMGCSKVYPDPFRLRALQPTSYRGETAHKVRTALADHEV